MTEFEVGIYKFHTNMITLHKHKQNKLLSKYVGLATGILLQHRLLPKAETTNTTGFLCSLLQVAESWHQQDEALKNGAEGKH